MAEDLKKDEILLGKIAVEKGIIAKEHLEECIRQQERSQPGSEVTLGAIMLAHGYVNEKQLQDLVNVQKERLRKQAPHIEETKAESIFGRLLLKYQLVTEDKINECLRLQAQMADRGIPMRLGEVLVKKGFLTTGLVKEVLSVQNKRMLFCRRCAKRYNVVRWDIGLDAKCPKCSESLQPPPLHDGIGVDGSDIKPAVCAEKTPRTERRGQPLGDRYDLLEKIGQGLLTGVYKVWDYELQRVLALKMLNPDEQDTPGRVESLHEKAPIMQGLRHYNTVAVHDIGTIDGKPYFTMDHIDGGTLDGYLKKRAAGTQAGGPKSSLRHAIEIMRDICSAVGHAHAHRVCHGWIKPSNVLMDVSGRPYVSDFGFGKHFGDIQRSSTAVGGRIVGTPHYLPPEKIAVDAKPGATPAGDVYSLGAVMYEVLCGARPFEADTFGKLCSKIDGCDMDFPKSIMPKIHADLESICMKAMHRSPEKRYPTANEMTEDLQRFLQGENVAAPAVGVLRRARLVVKRHALASALAAALLLAMVAVAGFMVARIGMRKARVESLVTQARRHLEKREFEPAIEDANAVAAIDAGNTAARDVKRGADDGMRAKALREDNERKKREEEERKRIERQERRRTASPFFDVGTASLTDANGLVSEGKADKARDKYTEAVSAFSKAAEMDGEYTEAFAMCAQALQSLGDFPGASEKITRAIEMERRPAFFEKRAEINLEWLLAMHNPVITQGLSGQLGASVTFEAAAPQETIGKLRKAITEDIEKVRVAQGREGAFHCLQGALLTLDGKLAEAVAALNDSVRLEAPPVQALRWRGLAYMLNNCADEAIADFGEVLKARQGLAQVLDWRGRCYMLAGRYDDAIAEFTRAIETDRSYVTAIENRGNARLRKNEFEGACNDFNAAIDKNPSNWRSYLCRGYVLYNLNRLAEAKSDMNKTIALNEKSGEAHCFRGLINEELQQSNLAEEDYNKAVELEPQYVQTYLRRGKLNLKQYKYREAAEDFRTFLRIAPDDPHAKDVRGWLEEAERAGK
jgi:tetratricopeptide (TPR) repeat protein